MYLCVTADERAHESYYEESDECRSFRGSMTCACVGESLRICFGMQFVGLKFKSDSGKTFLRISLRANWKNLGKILRIIRKKRKWAQLKSDASISESFTHSV